ncbi:hypothetical protein ARMSODRAFT_1014793 [Armillaria solidipes]|uniref:Uncharacterized protein n=1 Tax=Armillaria solidipes TaxID=1076256 RepID=A0A2H3BZT0_9AGAR|nr:hypothetical protein ARMSODRAFT_1014793 [Armillaria solidipes]
MSPKKHMVKPGSKVDMTCHCNVPAKRLVSHTKDNPERYSHNRAQLKFTYSMPPALSSVATRIKMILALAISLESYGAFTWEDSLVSPDSQPTPSTPLKRLTSDLDAPYQEKRPRLDDNPTQSTQASTQSSSQSAIERDVFSASQSQSQPKAEYTLTPVPMLKGEEESGLPTPSNFQRDGSPSQTGTHTPSTTLDLMINELKEHQGQIHTLERQKIAAEKERDARSRKLEYLASENKRLNESFQSVQSDLADHKNTVRALNAALLQYSQDSRSPGRDAR